MAQTLNSLNRTYHLPKQLSRGKAAFWTECLQGCGFVDGRQAMVWHLYSEHGWAKQLIAKEMGHYNVESINSILSTYKKRAAALGG